MLILMITGKRLPPPIQGHIPHSVYVINIRSDADLTLAVVGPKESYCNDDARRNSKNPSVLLPSPGRYQIFVGSKDQQPHPYTIEIADGAG